MENKSVDVIIPAYKPGKEFQELLARLMRQTVLPGNIFILQTVEDGEELLQYSEEHIKVVPIKRAEFDHGGTRDYGARLSEADYILLMTQDAMPKNEGVIEELLKGFTGEHVGMSYGRQLARKDDCFRLLPRRTLHRRNLKDRLPPVFPWHVQIFCAS